MAIDIDNIQTFTAAQQLAAVEYAIIAIMVGGQSVSIGGRQFTRASLDDLTKWRDQLKQEIGDASTDDSTGIALVRFGDPV